VDLVLRKGNERFLVQCKQWKAFKVSVQPVRELYGVMTARGAAGGFVVTSGRFTEDALAFADGVRLTLIDGERLLGLIQQARASLATKRGAPPPPITATAMSPVRAPPGGLAVIPSSAPGGETAPSCPVCSRGMVLKTAKRGPNAGGSFWGCVGYPVARAREERDGLELAAHPDFL
jgi:restriction system protein